MASRIESLSSAIVSSEFLAEAPPRDFEVVFICTGNRARSPFSAELFRRYSRDFPVVVRSVGALDLGPAPALREAVWAARTFEIELSQHRARPLLAGALESADLVVGFETSHIAAAVVDGGAARGRAFLMTELADLLTKVGDSRNRPLEWTVELAHGMRANAAVALPVRDPVGRPRQEFQRTFAQIDSLVAAIAVGLFGDRRFDPSAR